MFVRLIIWREKEMMVVVVRRESWFLFVRLCFDGWSERFLKSFICGFLYLDLDFYLWVGMWLWGRSEGDGYNGN